MRSYLMRALCWAVATVRNVVRINSAKRLINKTSYVAFVVALLITPSSAFEKIDLKPLNTEQYDLRWVTTEGGWRALSATMGYTNLFSRLGLLSSTHCNFTAISGTSGGTWFASQLMYSQAFFDNLAGADRDATTTQLFVQQWITTLVNYQISIPLVESPICKMVSKLNFVSETIANFGRICSVLHSVHGDWAKHIEQIFLRATTAYGDPTFHQRIMNYQNLLPAFKNTELYIYFGYAATSLIRRSLRHDTIVQVVPNNQSSTNRDTVYTIPIPFVYIVREGNTNPDIPNYYIVTESDSLPLQTRTRVLNSNVLPAQEFSASNSFEYRWPGSVYATQLLEKFSSQYRNLELPFGGTTATTAQLNGASSTAFAFISGSTPTLLAQWLSTTSLPVRVALGTSLYHTKVTNGLSVCSQWPNNDECYNPSEGKLNGRLIDGAFVEGTGLAINIGQYQLTNPNSSKKLKVIVTNNNQNFPRVVRFALYFNTSYNQGVEPGGYIWPPGDNFAKMVAPIRSMQIFNTELNYTDWIQREGVSIPGTNIVMATINATTIDNPIYGVRAGLQVEMLHVATNADIDPLIFNISEKDEYIVKCGRLAYAIANSTELISQITNFINNQ